MKKQIISLIFILLISSSIFAQSTDKLSSDEIARIKFSIHLINYETPNTFDNAQGEAYYTIVLSSFEENLNIPKVDISGVTAADKAIAEKLIQQFSELKQNPPTWDDLYAKQTEYLIWKDKVMSRSSKYKN